MLQHRHHVAADVQHLLGVLQAGERPPDIRPGILVEPIRVDHVVRGRGLGHLDEVEMELLHLLQPHPLVLGGELDDLVGLLRFGEDPQHQVLGAYQVPGDGERPSDAEDGGQLVPGPLFHGPSGVQDDLVPGQGLDLVPARKLQALIDAVRQRVGLHHGGAVLLPQVDLAPQRLGLIGKAVRYPAGLQAHEGIHRQAQLGHQLGVGMHIGPCRSTVVHQLGGGGSGHARHCRPVDLLAGQGAQHTLPRRHSVVISLFSCHMCHVLSLMCERRRRAPPRSVQFACPLFSCCLSTAGMVAGARSFSLDRKPATVAITMQTSMNSHMV